MSVTSISRIGHVMILVARLSLCLTLSIAVIPVTTAPAFAGKDDDKKKTGIFGQFFSRRSKPTNDDQPQASSSSSSSSRPKQIARTDKQSNIVPLTADEELDERERQDLASKLEFQNRKIEGNYQLGYKELGERFTNVSRLDRNFKVGDAPKVNDDFLINQAMLDLLLKANQRQENAEDFEEGSVEQGKQFEANQRLIGLGFVVIPNIEQYAALLKLSERPANENQPLANMDQDDRLVIRQYLAFNASMVKDAKKKLKVETTVAKIAQAEAIANGEKSFTGNANSPYDLPPDPARIISDDNDAQDDNSDASADTSRKERK